MKSLLIALVLLTSVSSFTQAHTVDTNKVATIKLNGEKLKIDINVGNFMSGQMYDLVKIGQYEFQINPYFSQAPVKYSLSGKDVDGAIIMLDLKKKDFEGSILEGREDAVLAQVANIRKMLLNDEIEEVVGKQDNILEIECNEKSNALIIITIKDSSNESKAKESFANCTTLTRK